MKDKICNLIDVKSIITISFTILFMILAIKGIIDGKEVVNIYTIIIAFYFGTQSQKVSNFLQNYSEKSNNVKNEEKTQK